MIRAILVFLIIFLIVRAFVIAGTENKEKKTDRQPEKKSPQPRKGVPREIGEYIEFEETGTKN
jgi:hypothetical protein